MARSLAKTLSLVLALSVCATAASATEPHDRTGFFIGLGLGGGSGELTVPGGESTDRESGGSGNFRLGWAVRPEVVLGLESAVFVRNEEVLGETVTFSFSAATFALTYFPGNMGLYFRGGAGFGQAKVETDIGGVKASVEENGLGFVGAAGYEWRLTKKFALGPQMEFLYLNIDGDMVESFNSLEFSVQATWYW